MSETFHAPWASRQQAIVHCENDLRRNGWPRLQMAVLVGVTGTVGAVASVLLLHAGIVAMWARWPFALVIAWCVFLLLLWVWLQRRALDEVDCSSVQWPWGKPDGPHATADAFRGAGGQFGGAGASGSFDGVNAPASSCSDGAAWMPDGSPVDAVGAADEIVAPLIAVVTLVALALASLYLVWAAPSLLAEVTVDAALSYTLYRRLRRSERRYWLSTAIARTSRAFLGTGAFLMALGVALAVMVPQAHTLGEAMRMLPRH